MLSSSTDASSLLECSTKFLQANKTPSDNDRNLHWIKGQHRRGALVCEHKAIHVTMKSKISDTSQLYSFRFLADFLVYGAHEFLQLTGNLLKRLRWFLCLNHELQILNKVLQHWSRNHSCRLPTVVTWVHHLPAELIGPIYGFKEIHSIWPNSVSITHRLGPCWSSRISYHW